MSRFHLQSLAVTVAGQRLQDAGMTSSLQPGNLEVLFPHPTSCVSPEGHGQGDFRNCHPQGKPRATLMQRDVHGAFLVT